MADAAVVLASAILRTATDDGGPHAVCAHERAHVERARAIFEPICYATSDPQMYMHETDNLCYSTPRNADITPKSQSPPADASWATKKRTNRQRQFLGRRAECKRLNSDNITVQQAAPKERERKESKRNASKQSHLPMEAPLHASEYDDKKTVHEMPKNSTHAGDEVA